MCSRGQFLTRSIGQDNNNLCDKQDHAKCASDCSRDYFSGNEEEEHIDLANWTGWTERRMQETKAIVERIDRFIAPAKYLMNRFVTDFNIPEHKIQYLDYGFDTSYLKPINQHKKSRPFTFG